MTDWRTWLTIALVGAPCVGYVALLLADAQGRRETGRSPWAWLRRLFRSDPYPPEAAEAPDREQVIAHVTFHVLGDGGRVPANLRYRRDDPYAVTVVFAGTNPWAFARELLHTVAVDRMPVGLGDVCWYERDATTLVLAIGSPDGRSALTIAHADVAAFLRDTYTVVPRGEEAEHLGLDAELALLLATEEAL